MSTVTKGVDVRAKKRDKTQTGGAENDVEWSHIVHLKRQQPESCTNIIQSQVSAATGKIRRSNGRRRASSPFLLFFTRWVTAAEKWREERKGWERKIALRKVKPTTPVRRPKGATLTTLKPSNNARGVHVWRKNHRHDSEADTDARVVQLRPSCGRKAFNLQRFEWNAPALESTYTEQRTYIKAKNCIAKLHLFTLL